MATLRERISEAHDTGLWPDDLIQQLYMLSDLLSSDVLPAMEQRLDSCSSGSDEWCKAWGGLVLIKGIADTERDR